MQWIGIRPGSIDVTVAMNSTSDVQQLAATVVSGGFVVSFNNVTVAASLITHAYVNPTVTPGISSSSSSLSSAAIAAISICMLLVFVVIVALVKNAATKKSFDPIESQAELINVSSDMAWDNTDVPPNIIPPLHFAVLLNNPDELERTISLFKLQGRSIDERDSIGQTALALAARIWSDRSVKILLDAG